jgi:hypothetical protein
MHKSRLGGLIIDCETDDLGVAEEFGTKALGYDTIQSSHPDDEELWSILVYDLGAGV